MDGLTEEIMDDEDNKQIFNECNCEMSATLWEYYRNP